MSILYLKMPLNWYETYLSSNINKMNSFCGQICRWDLDSPTFGAQHVKIDPDITENIKQK